MSVCRIFFHWSDIDSSNIESRETQKVSKAEEIMIRNKFVIKNWSGNCLYSVYICKIMFTKRGQLHLVVIICGYLLPKLLIFVTTLHLLWKICMIIMLMLTYGKLIYNCIIYIIYNCKTMNIS